MGSDLGSDTSKKVLEELSKFTPAGFARGVKAMPGEMRSEYIKSLLSGIEDDKARHPLFMALLSDLATEHSPISDRAHQGNSDRLVHQ